MIGDEALAPPTDQNMFSVSSLESLDFQSTRVQLGGPFERNAYSPDGWRKRSFNGFWGAIGVSQRLGHNSAFVVNYSHAYRAPSLD
jgi:hypothetical protein